MFRIEIIIFFLSYCASFFSQPVYSRDFEARKKNVPISIINNNSNYFFLLRYNKVAHDITLERRAKPSAEIISFTPLKLDSVNADWFNYEKLDYLFFENNYHVYFLFEKILNTKQTLYLKIIDTTGKSSGFIELASVEKEKGVTSINFEYKRTQNNSILIVATQTYGNFLAKKTALLFDLEKRKIVWAKKLPVENDNTGYSIAYECNNNNDLFCIFVKAHIASYKRRYMNHAQMMVPVLFFDSLSIVSFLNEGAFTANKKLVATNLSGLNSILLFPVKNDIIINAHLTKQDATGEVNTYFLNQKSSIDLLEEYYTVATPLDNSIKQALTFYDGSDYDRASEKEYRHFINMQENNFNYRISERVEEYYYKELLVWKNNLETGAVSNQKIIPRKLYSFQGRTQFKNITKAMPYFFDDKLNVVVLEATPNLKKDPNSFNYHKFKKETSLTRSNLVVYSLKTTGDLEKKLIYHNANFDAVPMSYQTNKQQELILYLNGGKREKFAILKLDQL